MIQNFGEKILVAGAVWREPAAGLPAPDPGDDHLWVLAGCHPGACLITGDRLPPNVRPTR